MVHLPCHMAWFFELNNNNQISEITQRECLNHQKVCPSTTGKISREEWEDNMQRSRAHQKDLIKTVNEKRDDIFRQIFG